MGNTIELFLYPSKSASSGYAKMYSATDDLYKAVYGQIVPFYELVADGSKAKREPMTQVLRMQQHCQFIEFDFAAPLVPQLRAFDAMLEKSEGLMDPEAYRDALDDEWDNYTRVRLEDVLGSAATAH